MKVKKQISKKNDRIFLLLILLLLLAVAGIFYFTHRGAGAQVEVTVDGVLYGTYSLTTEAEIPIIQDGITTNRLVIKNGMADMTEADCPDKLCVHQKAVSKNGETIVCLPNKVVVQVCGGEEGELDGVAK